MSNAKKTAAVLLIAAGIGAGAWFAAGRRTTHQAVARRLSTRWKPRNRRRPTLETSPAPIVRPRQLRRAPTCSS